MVIHLDFETRSTENLRAVGVYAYARHPSTEIVCAAYAIDDEPVQLWRMGELAPLELRRHLRSGDVTFHAWNANFERLLWQHCWSRPGNTMHPWGFIALERWHCTMAQGGLHGLPLDLNLAAKALGLSKGKDMEGHRLMMKMSKPRSKKGVEPVVWWNAPADFEKLGLYCMQDVRVERDIARRLRPMPYRERQLYRLDQTINDRGMRLDEPLAEAALVCATKASLRANGDLRRATGGQVDRINKVEALLKWLHSQGHHVDDLTAETVDILLTVEPPGPVRDALMVRQDAARSSVKKLDTMLTYAKIDGRMRGMLQFAGAATGRWAGRGVQPQNFPRGTGLQTEMMIPLVMLRDLAALDWYASPLELLSGMLRSMMIAAPRHTLIAGDYAAIEARVLAWLAGQEDLLKMFRQGVDPYKDMASKVYGVTVQQVTKPQRQLGKTAVLALGYGMGRVTFQRRCALQGIAITSDFADSTVQLYRRTNHKIKALWDGLERAAMDAVRHPTKHCTFRRIAFEMRGIWLEMILPSGRSLFYHDARIELVQTPWGDTRESVVANTFFATIHQWGPRSMYGGLWVENAVQAIARDLLAEAMLTLESHGFPLVLTVHDEIVAEVPVEEASLVEEFKELMSKVPPWADGCPIAVEAWEGQRYRK